MLPELLLRLLIALSNLLLRCFFRRFSQHRELKASASVPRDQFGYVPGGAAAAAVAGAAAAPAITARATVAAAAAAEADAAAIN